MEATSSLFCTLRAPSIHTFKLIDILRDVNKCIWLYKAFHKVSIRKHHIYPWRESGNIVSCFRSANSYVKSCAWEFWNGICHHFNPVLENCDGDSTGSDVTGRPAGQQLHPINFVFQSISILLNLKLLTVWIIDWPCGSPFHTAVLKTKTGTQIFEE